MASLFDLWDELVRDQTLVRLMNSPQIQFGTETKSYLGADLLPERTVSKNMFREDKIVYKTFPAVNGTRYSEPKMRGQQLVGGFDVKLGEVDTASQLTGQDLDDLIEIAERDPAAAKSRLITWMVRMFPIALAEKAEIDRWQAFCHAQVPIMGQDGNSEIIELPNPAGHRRTIPGGTLATPAGWYADDYDPMEDFTAVRQLAANKGMKIRRVIGDVDISSALSLNNVMQQRLGSFTIANGELTTRRGLVEKADIDAYLQSRWGLPPIEEYDETYNIETGTGQEFFKPRGDLVFFCSTDREETFTDEDEVRIIPQTLGYYAIGIPVAQTSPGKRFAQKSSMDLKPVGIYGQGYMTSFPVIQEPEAIIVLRIQKPTAE